MSTMECSLSSVFNEPLTSKLHYFYLCPIIMGRQLGKQSEIDTGYPTMENRLLVDIVRREYAIMIFNWICDTNNQDQF